MANLFGEGNVINAESLFGDAAEARTRRFVRFLTVEPLVTNKPRTQANKQDLARGQMLLSVLTRRNKISRQNDLGAA